MVDTSVLHYPLPGAVVNIASVPQLSPFRYPGGKTWLIPWIRRWLAFAPRHRSIVEPFAGGGAISLTAVFEELVDHAVLVEIDDDVAAVWETIFSLRAPALAETVIDFQCSVASVTRALASTPNSIENRAFRTLVMNRARYGGIIAPGAAPVRRGENGRGVSSRWYPETLKKRILAIAKKRDRFALVHGDGMEFLRRARRYRSVVFFIDPPYTVTGRRLYTHSEVDHELLFHHASQLAGDFLMTYDDAQETRQLAQRHGFQVEMVPMQSTKHATKMELLIGRHLGWARNVLASRELLEDTLLEDMQTNGEAGRQAFH